jgi:hypothetical protein
VDRFSESIRILNLMKISSVGAKMLHADGHTSRRKTHTHTHTQTDGNTRRSEWSPFEILQTRLKSVVLFSACDCTHLQNFIKLRIHCLINCYVVRYIVAIKDFSLHLVNFSSNNILPTQANVSSTCNMIIHKVPIVD